jgi:hypothetical protein
MLSRRQHGGDPRRPNGVRPVDQTGQTLVADGDISIRRPGECVRMAARTPGPDLESQFIEAVGVLEKPNLRTSNRKSGDRLVLANSYPSLVISAALVSSSAWRAVLLLLRSSPFLWGVCRA